jgi:hypothetical protein
VYLSDFLGVLTRRWVVFCLGMVAVAYVGWHVLTTVKSDYQASGEMVLLLPPDVAVHPTNPYLNLPDGLSTVASLTAADVMSEDTQHELAQRGLIAEYDVALVPGTGPLLVITTEDKDPDQAVTTRDAVLAEINSRIARLQGGLDLPERQVISSRSFNVGRHAEVLPGSRLRALAGAAGAGVLLVLMITFGLDRALARRGPSSEGPGRDCRQRRPSPRRSGAPPHADDEPTTTERTPTMVG